MRYPFKVIVKGKVYGEATTMAEAQDVAKAQGGYVARIANPDLLTGKIRQREDGGHYVRTRKDKRPAEVDITAGQVAGDWRTQLAHSGHAPAPKPPKAPKVKAVKVVKPKPPKNTRSGKPREKPFFDLVDSEILDLSERIYAQLRPHGRPDTRATIGFCAALCIQANFTEPKLALFHHPNTPYSVQEVAKTLDYDIGRVGALCWSLLDGAGATEHANEVKRATLAELKQPADWRKPRWLADDPVEAHAPTAPAKTSLEIAAEKYPKATERRQNALAKAIALGANDTVLAQIAGATSCWVNSDTAQVPFGRYAHTSRATGFARTGKKPNYRYAESGDSGWIVDGSGDYGNAIWEVVSRDGFQREEWRTYRVKPLLVGGQTWTVAFELT
jgi:hypothetical protein